uniref:Uncharacterized protein n=1 Tax=Arundo donax TaxID=35708 RepID=A0A0A9HZI9_ARUDO
MLLLTGNSILLCHVDLKLGGML